MDQKRATEILERATRPDGFPYFVKHVFSQSVDILKNGVWTEGEFIDDIALWLQSNDKTIRVSAKDHFKSTSFYAHIMWKILRLFVTGVGREIQYFSYKESMAAYHLGKIKQAIKCNPFFETIQDHKERAEGVISYSWDGKHKITVTPRGLLEFKRGIHCPDVYVDDPFQDPENKLVPLKIKRINDVMKNQVIDMPQNELHVVGTAQTNHDFFFDKDFTARFSVRILPAIVNEANKEVLWKEWMNWEELQAKKRERGEKMFNQEYLVRPVYSENSYFSKERLETAINPKLVNYSFKEWDRRKQKLIDEESWVDYDYVAGWDLGKKNHPAHFCVFQKQGKKRVQVHSKWFDGVDYTTQLQHIEEAIDCFGIYRVFYDGTRGELEMMEETGELRGEFEGVHFTVKAKNSMANAMDRGVTNKELELLPEERQKNQILIVTDDLQAPETPEGHGDAFWSIGLSHRDMENEGGDVSFM